MDLAAEDNALRRLAGQLTRLTRDLLDATSVAGALQRIVVVVAEVVAGADLVSVTLRGSNGEFHTPAQTDPMAGLLDRLQYDFAEGPCVEAARPGGPIVAISDDLSVESAWPRFAPVAAARGYASIVSTALLPDSRHPRLSGALNIYSTRRGGLSATDRDIALLLAAHASLVLATTQAVTAAELQAAHLRKAIESRDVIGQAKGILMQRRGISADEAFDILRRASQGLNVKLADLAQTLSTGHAELPPELATWLDR
ncbi:MAG TPA: ANTAR domain-containing protein [Pseudonocardiaceae bacterium]